MRSRLIVAAALTLAVLFTVMLSTRGGRAIVQSIAAPRGGGATVESRLDEVGPQVDAEIRAWCERADAVWPPSELVLLADKSERQLHVLSPRGREWVELVALPILGASGELGPKLREGDGQVPEGIYAVESLHPNSRFHLALRLGYPNAFDRAKGRSDGRTNLGGDIMIHGGSASIGCLAMGDEAIERIFALTAAVGVERTRVVIVPADLRSDRPPTVPNAPTWIDELYTSLARELERYPPAK